MLVVASVPHSGSRSLLRHLGETSISSDNLWHFGYHDHLIEPYEGLLHIPLRNPKDILLSWHGRGKNLLECLRCMAKMVEYANPQTVWHRTEDLPEKVGSRPKSPKSLRFEAALYLHDKAPPKVIEYYEQHGGYQI
jgi:hypothetical protein